MKKAFSLRISITLSLSHFCLKVSNTHSRVLPVSRVTNASFNQMTLSHWFTVQLLCFSAHFNRSRAASDVNFGRLRASQWEISWARSVTLRVLAFKSISMFIFSCLQMILDFDRNWRSSILAAQEVIDKDLSDLSLLTSKNAVQSLSKTSFMMMRETLKFRLIWVSVASSSACLVILSLVNKSSFFLKILLSEIVVNEALLSMMNVIEEGWLFWRYAILRVFA